MISLPASSTGMEPAATRLQGRGDSVGVGRTPPSRPTPPPLPPDVLADLRAEDRHDTEWDDHEQQRWAEYDYDFKGGGDA